MAKKKLQTITPIWIKGKWTYTMPENVREKQHCNIVFPNGKVRKVIMPEKRTNKILYVPSVDIYKKHNRVTSFPKKTKAEIFMQYNKWDNVDMSQPSAFDNE